MRRSASVFLRVFLLCTLLCVVWAEGGRQKKDVHHMIVLNEDGRPPKLHRAKTSSLGSRTRRKRKPAKPKARPASSEEEDSEEMHKAKSKKRVKSDKQPKSKKPQISIEDYSYADTKWNPMSSGEFFHKSQQPPMVPVSGSMHLGFQPEPMEITTSHSNFYTTAYPPFPPIYQQPNFGSIQQPYRPFDYSAGEPQSYLSAVESDQHGEASAVTPFSIVVASVEEKGQKVQEAKKETSTKPTGRGKMKKGRGTSRFKVRRNERWF